MRLNAISGDAYLPLTGGTLSGTTTVSDDTVVAFGTGNTVSVLYETADANANAMIFVAPEGGATDVPAFIFGDASILNSDLGWFDGLTEPSLVVVNDAKDAYIRIDSGDDSIAGSQGIYFKAAADEDIELLNLSVTGTPRIFWDESEDQISSSKGWVFGGDVDIGTNALCDPGGNDIAMLSVSNGFKIVRYSNQSLIFVTFADGDIQVTNTGAVKTGAADNDVAYFKAVDNDGAAGAYLTVGGLKSANDPYMYGGGSEEFKFYNSGYMTISANADLSGSADMVKVGAYDLSAGNRTLALATETAVAADVALASTHSLSVRINGASYKVPLVAL